MLLALVMLLVTPVPARMPSFEEREAVRDSLSAVEPWMRRSWLAERGLEDWFRSNSHEPKADSGLSIVGRWSYGPSVKVSLRVTNDDTIVCLARGSGASVIRFRSRDSLTLDLLSDINCSGIVCRAIIQDTLVYYGMNQGGTGIEVWGISDLASPNRLSYVHLPPIMDIAVQDTFLYTTGYVQDSLRIFSIADPHNPRRLGACSDSGFPMCVSGNYCYLADQYGLNIVDVSDPTAPHRAAGIGGYEALSVTVRDTLCFVGTHTSDFTLRVYNVRNPASPVPIGSLAGVEASDIYLPPTCDTILYTPKLHVINIEDPRNPRQLGFVDCPGWDYGVRAVPALNYALVADYFKGMVAVGIGNPAAPLIDTVALAGDEARDVAIDNGRAYLASYHSGLQILDVTDPARPSYLGGYDTAGTAGVVRSATAKDSFAYVAWPMPRVLTVDVTDPRRPQRAAGTAGMFAYPEDMVIRDSFVYCAEGRRFQIVNVARPREPVLAGSCVIQDGVFGLAVEDSLAFVAGTSLQILSIAEPASPQVIFTGGRPSIGVALSDTFLYVPSFDTVFVYSIADPAQPRLLSQSATGRAWDVALGDSRLFIGTNAGVEAYDVTNPVQPRRIGAAAAPYGNSRLCYANGYVYSAMWEAGVAVYETAGTAITEPGTTPVLALPLPVAAYPNPASGLLRVGPLALNNESVEVRDAAGRLVRRAGSTGKRNFVEIEISALRSGVYFVQWGGGEIMQSAKFVKR